MLFIISVERLFHIASHFSLRKWRRRPHFLTKLAAAAASFSYKIGGGGKDLATLLAAVLTWSGYWFFLYYQVPISDTAAGSPWGVNVYLVKIPEIAGAKFRLKKIFWNSRGRITSFKNGCGEGRLRWDSLTRRSAPSALHFVRRCNFASNRRYLSTRRTKLRFGPEKSINSTLFLAGTRR